MEEIHKNNLNLIEDIIASYIKSEAALRIEATSKSPFIFMDPNKGLIIIKGIGIPEDPFTFFKQPLDFFDRKFTGVQSIEGHFMLTYFNSDFAKLLQDLFKKFGNLYRRNHTVVCYWYYDEDDDDMLQWGEDFESIIRMPFVKIEIPC